MLISFLLFLATIFRGLLSLDSVVISLELFLVFFFCNFVFVLFKNFEYMDSVDFFLIIYFMLSLFLEFFKFFGFVIIFSVKNSEKNISFDITS